MPERLDRVTIELKIGNIAVPSDARQALHTRLQLGRLSTSLRAMFDAVGASRPVELNPAQRATLLGMLDEWDRDDSAALPTELDKLRRALRDDLAGLA